MGYQRRLSELRLLHILTRSYGSVRFNLRWMQKPSTTGSSESHWGFMFMVIGVICVPIGAAFGVYWRDHPPDMR